MQADVLGQGLPRSTPRSGNGRGVRHRSGTRHHRGLVRHLLEEGPKRGAPRRAVAALHHAVRRGHPEERMAGGADARGQHPRGAEAALVRHARRHRLAGAPPRVLPHGVLPRVLLQHLRPGGRVLGPGQAVRGAQARSRHGHGGHGILRHHERDPTHGGPRVRHDLLRARGIRLRRGQQGRCGVLPGGVAGCSEEPVCTAPGRPR
mmetsp:Transcript_8780/g.19415  ORF Transcript_8780/g.19415 Transcript_8780/m.19415 type:complete len:205 (-) Transcript_8780:155-769(-)